MLGHLIAGLIEPLPLHQHLGQGMVQPTAPVMACKFKAPEKPVAPVTREARRWLAVPSRVPAQRATWELNPVEQETPDLASILRDLYTLADGVVLAGKTVQVRTDKGYLVVEVVG